MRELVILGGNRLHAGFAMKKQELGIDKIIVVDWNARPDFAGDLSVCCDIKDADAVWASSAIRWEQVMCVYTSADAGTASQAELHRRMGLLTPAQEALDNARIKGRSSACWEKAGILNKYSKVLAAPEAFTRYDGGSYIWKPNCASGSRNITILEGDDVTPQSAKEAWQLAAQASADHCVIVEEFCRGTEYTVEMLGDGMGHVAVYGISKKYHTPYNTQNKIAVNLHFCPADVSDDRLEAIAAFGAKCYRALGLSASFGHLEIIEKEDGTLVPVEMGARSSGFIASHLIDLIHGKTVYLPDYARVLRGGAVRDGITYPGTRSAMYYFYDVQPGIMEREKTILDFLPSDIQSFAHSREGLKAGRYYAPIQADHQRYGFEILAGDRKLLTIQAVEQAQTRWNCAVMKEETQ